MNTALTIEPYQQKWAPDFKRLNTAWLEEFFEVEPVDHQMLSNPEEYYINKGGFIYFALVQDTVVGCYALIKSGKDCFELSKMAVDKAYQGHQIGHAMVQHALATAAGLGAVTLQLYSHKRLGAAIHLYKKYGFEEIPVGNSIYKRSDIRMEKKLTT